MEPKTQKLMLIVFVLQLVAIIGSLMIINWNKYPLASNKELEYGLVINNAYASLPNPPADSDNTNPYDMGASSCCNFSHICSYCGSNNIYF